MPRLALCHAPRWIVIDSLGQLEVDQIKLDVNPEDRRVDFFEGDSAVQDESTSKTATGFRIFTNNNYSLF